jgi:hypothetical protein
MSEKKMVRRSVAIALGITCIILIAGLSGAFAYYMIDRNNSISALNSQISDKNGQISGLNVTVTNLNNTVRDLNDTVNLDKFKVVYNTSAIVQTDPPFQGLDLPRTFVDDDHARIGNTALDSNFNYAGYIVVKISSTSNDTYINYTCASHVGTFNMQTDIGMNGTTVLPVLPLAHDYWDYPLEGIFITVSTHTLVPARINTTMTYYY